MKYRAIVIGPEGMYSKTFNRFSDAAGWLDVENNNTRLDTMIETIKDDGTKEDSFFYTKKAG